MNQERILRGVVALPGLIFLVNGLLWIFAPEQAAKQIEMPLLQGIARSSEIGDLGAFFMATAGMILLGAATARPTWLQAAAMLVGGAAAIRTLAWLLHDAPFATRFIVFELAITGLLLFAAARFAKKSG